MRQGIVTLLAVCLAACGDNPTDPPTPPENQVRVLNGPATCDACEAVNFTVAGPGLDKVIDASLKHHATHEAVETIAEIRHFVGDSGPVLLIRIGFAGSAPKGDYDLYLRTVEIGGADGSPLIVPVAVKITTPPPGPEIPPPPPGPIGTLRVTVTTSGPVPTVQYLVTVNPCDPDYVCPGRYVDPTGIVSIQLNPGRYAIGLANLPSNCTVVSAPTPDVPIVADRTTNVSISVTCLVVPSGTIRISAPTTGITSRVQFEAIVSPCDQVHACSVIVAPGGTGTIVQRTGNYTVSLGNVPPACTVAEPRSVAVTVVAGQAVDISFSVTCPPAGTVHVTAAVTGPNPDDTFLVTEGDCDYYYYYCDSKELLAGASVDFSLAPGSHLIGLTGYAQNCSVDVPNPRTVTVMAGERTDITFAVTCIAMTTIRVSVPVTGPDADAGFLVGVGDCPRSPCTQQWVESGGVTLFEVPAGTYAVQLTDVASNCTLSGTNPVLVATSPGSATEVTFPVTCIALPVVRVTAPTTGTNRDASYIAVNETACDYYYGCWQQVLPATGAVQFKVTPGDYVFRLIDIAGNCTVTGPNPVTVHVVLGVNPELAFPVTCQ